MLQCRSFQFPSAIAGRSDSIILPVRKQNISRLCSLFRQSTVYSGTLGIGNVRNRPARCLRSSKNTIQGSADATSAQVYCDQQTSGLSLAYMHATQLSISHCYVPDRVGSRFALKNCKPDSNENSARMVITMLRGVRNFELD